MHPSLRPTSSNQNEINCCVLLITNHYTTIPFFYLLNSVVILSMLLYPQIQTLVPEPHPKNDAYPFHTPPEFPSLPSSEQTQFNTEIHIFVHSCQKFTLIGHP